MRTILIAFALAACVTTPDIDTAARPADPDPSTVCAYELCDFDFQCDDVCSGPARCAATKCDNCPGVCVLRTATP